MAILGFIVAAISAIAVWYWRIRVLRDMARDAGELAGDVRSGFRRYGFQRQSGLHPTASVTDPRLGAVAMMAAITRLDGALTETQLTTLAQMAQEAFEVDAREADDMLAYGRWLCDQSHDPDDAVRRLTPLLRDRASRTAHLDLMARMRRLAALHGGVSPAQETMLRRLEDGLGLRER